MNNPLLQISVVTLLVQTLTLCSVHAADQCLFLIKTALLLAAQFKVLKKNKEQANSLQSILWT